MIHKYAQETQVIIGIVTIPIFCSPNLQVLVVNKDVNVPGTKSGTAIVPVMYLLPVPVNAFSHRCEAGLPISGSNDNDYTYCIIQHECLLSPFRGTSFRNVRSNSGLFHHVAYYADPVYDDTVCKISKFIMKYSCIFTSELLKRLLLALTLSKCYMKDLCDSIHQIKSFYCYHKNFSLNK